MSCHSLLIPRAPPSQSSGMGHFSLTKKKGNDGAELSRNTKAGIVIFNIAFSRPNETKQPALKIDTRIANNLTPPPTPTSPQSVKGYPFGSPKWSHHGTATPNNSPMSNASRLSSGSASSQSTTYKSQTQSPRRKSFPLLSMFKTPRQRKLQEIREGKLPDIQPDPENNRNSMSSVSSDVNSVPTEICDPSSSTTYSPTNRQTKPYSNSTTYRKANPISTAMAAMQRSF